MKQSGINGLTPEQIRKAIYGRNKEENSCDNKFNFKNEKLNKPEKVVRKKQDHDAGMLLNMPFTTTSLFSNYKTPDWFESKNKADISVIVPIYNTEAKNFINSWNIKNKKVEVIFVDDNCPLNSKELIIKECEKNKNINGKIYSSSLQQGWCACCNAGAEIATGDILFFIHPDSILIDGWMDSMIKELNNKDVGVVGGLSIDQDGSTYLDAGFNWNWEEKKFNSIGKEIYNGIKISNPFTINNFPLDLLKSNNVDKVNGYFMAVRKKDYLFNGGMSPNLSSVEWADADFCMFMKEKGFKIICQCNSQIIREPLFKIDRKYNQGNVFFNNKWVTSGRINSLVLSKTNDYKKEIKSIVIRRRSAHGDVLIASGVASALKNKYPKSQIIFSTDCPEVLEKNPFIDKVVEIHSERWFDLYFDLDMAYEYRPNCNILQAYAEACGVNVDDCEIYLHSSNFENLPEKYVVIHSGKTMWAGRNWSTIKFDQIANKLKLSGFKVVVIGTLSDHKTSVCDIDLRGLTNIGELSYVIKKSKLFIGIDSFPMHVAQVLKIPGVCFFGSINPETRLLKNSSITEVFAEDLKCIGCHHRKSTPCTATINCEIGIQDCINNVTVDKMWRSIQKILDVDNA